MSTGVVTTTSTVPTSPGGLVTVIEVAVWAAMVPAVVPNVTAVTPVNPVPVTVTDVPPATNPWVGLMLVTTGAAR